MKAPYNYYNRAIAIVNSYCLNMFGSSIDDVGYRRMEMLACASKISDLIEAENIKHNKIPAHVNAKINDVLDGNS